MLVSFNWLKEYLDLSVLDPIALGDQLSLTGIEVENTYDLSAEITGITVGQVTECVPIPDTHLQATKVDVGGGQIQDIVCGAPNVAQGQKVIVALPGAVLPGGFEIGERKMQGHPSNGMICSLQELGFAEKVVPKKYVDGIYVFPDDVEVGEDAKAVLGLDDVIYDFDLTPNRSDALSMRGVAHEVGAIISQTPDFSDIPLEETDQLAIDDLIKVEVDQVEDTPSYQIRLVQNVEVAESPMWLQRKIMAAGMRPIDNLVDITNYIMMEYGQPLHAFDNEKIATDRIFVRRAEEGEVLTTLDGKDRQLIPEDIVITDGDQPIALAGVMGGENSDISDTTQHVALEAAVFDPLSIRRTSSRLNLRSEASSRFEKGVNLDAVERALDHAAYLLADLGGGQVVKGIAAGSSLEAEAHEIEATVAYLENIIGIDLTKVIIFDILDRLGFDYIDQEDDQFTVIVPPRRRDVVIKADVAEEVARIYGFNNLPNLLPESASIPGKLNALQKLTRQTRNLLEGLGLNEAISYSLTSKSLANRFAMDESPDTRLALPMSEEHETLRKSLIPGLLQAAQYNKARSTDAVLLYELGRIYHGTPGEELLNELEHVAGLATGKMLDDWTGQALSIDFFVMKGMVENLVDSFKLADPVSFQPLTDIEDMHPGRTAKILLKDQTIGLVGQIHPTTAGEFDLSDVYIFELDLDAVNKAEKASTVVKDIPKYPGIGRDVALLVNRQVSNRDIVTVIKDAAGPWLQSVQLFDYYEGEGIEDDKKSLAYSLFYQNPNETLVEEDIQADFDRVTQALEEKLGAEIR